LRKIKMIGTPEMIERTVPQKRVSLDPAHEKDVRPAHISRLLPDCSSEDHATTGDRHGI